MASLNKLLLIGRLGKDGELKYLASGTPICEFSLATDHSYKKGETWEKETEWHNVKLFGDVAERLAEHLTKGKQVYIEGRLQTRSWDGNDGVKHYRTEVVASTVQLLDKAPAQDGKPSARSAAPARSQGAKRGQPEPFDADSLPWE